MSTHLNWSAIPKGRSVGGPQIKELFRDVHTLSGEDFEYLKGLRDAGTDGADELIKAIQKHDRIRVWISE